MASSSQTTAARNQVGAVHAWVTAHVLRGHVIEN